MLILLLTGFFSVRWFHEGVNFDDEDDDGNIFTVLEEDMAEL